ncbi:deoxyribonuclease-1-like 1 isoform X2 [Dromaius novaehollandiae]|uniref:deoxyribonuclease-1-like 1 isoform X2 n=1 Tax=Dromaius novaehollandiae TaxID=8790 RepID=UPI00311F0A81
MGPAVGRALLLAALLGGAAAFRIGAFNARRLGGGKAARDDVRGALGRIITRCDIMVLQEVTDTKGQVVPLLLNTLDSTAGPGAYQALSSPPLGRGSYQERYVYFYRPGRAQLWDWFVYEDTHPQRPDVFAREPFVARFSLPSPALPELVLVPLHAAPGAAEAEIDALHDVYERVRERWGQQDVLFLGDFNAGCGYVAASRWGRIRLRHDPPFRWLLGDDSDSTVRGSTHCPYDRVVVAGERSQSLVVPGSARTFNFTAHFGLTEEQALAVSDHYPVEVELALDGAWGGPQHPPLALLLGLGGALLRLP